LVSSVFFPFHRLNLLGHPPFFRLLNQLWFLKASPAISLLRVNELAHLFRPRVSSSLLFSSFHGAEIVVFLSNFAGADFTSQFAQREALSSPTALTPRSVSPLFTVNLVGIEGDSFPFPDSVSLSFRNPLTSLSFDRCRRNPVEEILAEY